jgi:hypothetical protein
MDEMKEKSGGTVFFWFDQLEFALRQTRKTQ